MSTQASDPRLAREALDGISTRKIILATAVGNGMEWYDFALYGYLATYLAKNFFPAATPLSGFLNIMLIFGIAFLFRPLGGWILGPLGDIKGRQYALIVTIGMMAAATFCVGILPSHDTIGMLAPIGLVILRSVQGFSAGGEQGPAVTFLSEHAPEGRRGFFASFIQSSSIAGFLIAASVVSILTAVLSEAQMQEWGWRIPFLLALPFGLVGLFIRYGLSETPEFETLKRQGKTSQTPVKTALRTEMRPMLKIAAIVALQQAGYYTVFSYFPGHLQRLGYAPSQTTAAAMTALCLAMIAVPAFGALSDRIGRRPVLVGAATILLLITVPIFAVLGSLSYVGVICAQLALTVAVAAYNGTVNATYSELLGAETRSGALSIGFNMGTLIFGSPALYVMTLLNTTISAPWAPGIYVVFAAAISLAVAVTLKRPRTASSATL